MARYYYWNKKETTEEQIWVDISKAKPYLKTGYASMTATVRPSGSTFGWSISYHTKQANFNYTSTDRQTGEKTTHDYTRELVFTDCQFGGKRPWFLCTCGRRVRVLYLGGRDTKFYCRHCLNLAYKSTQKTRYTKPIFKLLESWTKHDDIYDKEPKTKYYKGKMTRKYKKWTEKVDKMSNSFFEDEHMMAELMNDGLMGKL